EEWLRGRRMVGEAVQEHHRPARAALERRERLPADLERDPCRSHAGTLLQNHGAITAVPNSRASQNGAAGSPMHPHAGGAQLWNHTSSEVMIEPSPPTIPMSKPIGLANAVTPNVAGSTAISMVKWVPSVIDAWVTFGRSIVCPLLNACSRLA